MARHHVHAPLRAEGAQVARVVREVPGQEIRVRVRVRAGVRVRVRVRVRVSVVREVLAHVLAHRERACSAG